MNLIMNVTKTMGLSLALLASQYSSANFECQVDLHRVLVYQNGSVNVLHTGRGDYTQICNLKGNWKNIDTVTCSMWTSMLQNLQNNNKKAEFYYNGSGSCSTLPTYTDSPAPKYIGSVK